MINSTIVMKKIICAIVVLIYVCSFIRAQAASGAGAPALQLPKDAVALQKVSADVTGDKIKDNIILYGVKFDKTALFYKNIFIVINKTLIKLPKDSDGGYEPKLILKDFDGDKISDIFLSSATGGSGGIMLYHIYSLKGGKARLIFSPTPDSAIIIKGSYQPDYKVNITVQQTGKTYTFDFSSRKNTYDDPNVGLYKAGKLLKKTDVYIDYYGRLDPVDTDKDGVYELKGIQAIWGVAHVDILATVTSTWKWVKNKWSVKKVDIKQVILKDDTASD